jgi:Asp-tRNA(Asn)/Glu-tRNA(Gln) amidotransferase A subunit family amidase
MITSDMINLTAVEATGALKQGELGLLEYVDALLDRCEQYQHLNAFVTLDGDKLREQTKALQNPVGPLYGLPLIIKDNIDVAGMPTTACTPALENWYPPEDATVIRNIIDAGGQVLGKASMHELALGISSDNDHYGDVCNPYDLDCIPGGSSSGTAVAIVARLVSAGLGSDTGGSCRMPASLCGCVGFRPSTGRYEGAGMVRLSWSRDTSGPLARTVEDIVLLDQICSGAEPRPGRDRSLEGVRLGIPRVGFYEGIDSETGRVVETALQQLGDAGAILVEVNLSRAIELDILSSFPAVMFETVRELSVYLGRNASSITVHEVIESISDQAIKAMLAQQYSKDAVTEEVYIEGMVENRPRLKKLYSECFEEHKLDAVVVPTTPVPARSRTETDVNRVVELNGREVDTFFTYIRNVSPASNLGLPALSIPAGLTSAGLPVGIEFVGKRMEDAELLSIGCAYERVRPVVPGPSLAARSSSIKN